eukprot:TRINITY_DN3625_c0_g2_i1.p1 TRINITY_DN3625_c0_g2~~TRINITY_DN3625_c0_g2_i1.p1  ORF type:complete len:559 (-),score=95.43 TRINITY_DN3625_c0_g2_i1:9-1685(-)
MPPPPSGRRRRRSASPSGPEALSGWPARGPVVGPSQRPGLRIILALVAPGCAGAPPAAAAPRLRRHGGNSSPTLATTARASSRARGAAGVRVPRRDLPCGLELMLYYSWRRTAPSTARLPFSFIYIFIAVIAVCILPPADGFATAAADESDASGKQLLRRVGSATVAAAGAEGTSLMQPHLEETGEVRHKPNDAVKQLMTATVFAAIEQAVTAHVIAEEFKSTAVNAAAPGSSSSFLEVEETSIPQVWCGGHHASECAACTVGRGEKWCHGDCVWSGTGCAFRSDLVWCGLRATETCAQCVGDLLMDLEPGKFNSNCKGDCTIANKTCMSHGDAERHALKLKELAAAKDDGMPPVDQMFYSPQPESLPKSRRVHMAFFGYGCCKFDNRMPSTPEFLPVEDCLTVCAEAGECIAAQVGGADAGTIFGGSAEEKTFGCVYLAGQGKNFEAVNFLEGDDCPGQRCYRKIIPGTTQTRLDNNGSMWKPKPPAPAPARIKPEDTENPYADAGTTAAPTAAAGNASDDPGSTKELANVTAKLQKVMADVNRSLNETVTTATSAP